MGSISIAKSWIWIIVAFSAGFAVPNGTVAAKELTAYLAKQRVELRAGPGTNFKVLVTLKKGDNIARVGKSKRFRGVDMGVDGPPVCKGGWCHVTAKGKFGYIPAGSFRVTKFKAADEWGCDPWDDFCDF